MAPVVTFHGPPSTLTEIDAAPLSASDAVRFTVTEERDHPPLPVPESWEATDGAVVSILMYEVPVDPMVPALFTA